MIFNTERNIEKKDQGRTISLSVYDLFQVYFSSQFLQYSKARGHAGHADQRLPVRNYIFISIVWIRFSKMCMDSVFEKFHFCRKKPIKIFSPKLL